MSWFAGCSGGAAGACILALAVATEVSARPAGVITDIRGKVSVQGSDRRFVVGLLAEVGDGEELDVAAGARATIAMYWTGHDVLLRGPAGVRVGYGGPESLRGIPPAKRDGGDLPGLNASGLMLAAASVPELPGVRLRLVSPVGLRLLELRPAFRWEPIAGAAEYQFTLSAGNGSTIYETQVREPRLTLPAWHSLSPGASFAWKVSAVAPDGIERAGMAIFSTASADLAAQAKRYRPAPQATFADRVRYALWLRQSGLHDEARHQWQALRRLRPREPLVVRLAAE